VQRDRRPLVHDPPCRGLGRERAQDRQRLARPVDRRRGRQQLDVLVDEVDRRFGVGAQVEQVSLEIAQPAREGAFELVERRLPVLLPLRGDELLDGLRLGQVEAPVEKRAQRELAGLRRTGAAGAEVAEESVDQRRRAREMDLDEVFAGVGAGSFIDDGPGNGAAQFDGAGAAQPDDGPQARPRRSGESDDGLITP
jgi:hypothetical protein